LRHQSPPLHIVRCLAIAILFLYQFNLITKAANAYLIGTINQIKCQTDFTVTIAQFNIRNCSSL